MEAELDILGRGVRGQGAGNSQFFFFFVLKSSSLTVQFFIDLTFKD